MLLPVHKITAWVKTIVKNSGDKDNWPAMKVTDGKSILGQFSIFVPQRVINISLTRVAVTYLGVYIGKNRHNVNVESL